MFIVTTCLFDLFQPKKGSSFQNDHQGINVTLFTSVEYYTDEVFLETVLLPVFSYESQFC